MPKYDYINIISGSHVCHRIWLRLQCHYIFPGRTGVPSRVRSKGCGEERVRGPRMTTVPSLYPSLYLGVHLVLGIIYEHVSRFHFSTCLGVQCKDGVVMGVEKTIVSKMLVEGSNRRLYTINTNTGMGTAGLSADARQLVNFAR